MQRVGTQECTKVGPACETVSATDEVAGCLERCGRTMSLLVLFVVVLPSSRYQNLPEPLVRSQKPLQIRPLNDAAALEPSPPLQLQSISEGLYRYHSSSMMHAEQMLPRLLYVARGAKESLNAFASLSQGLDDVLAVGARERASGGR